MRILNLSILLVLCSAIYAQDSNLVATRLNKTIDSLKPIVNKISPGTPPALPALESGALQLKYWFEEIDHNGISPFIANGTSWKVYRNVKDYGAKGDGVTDDAAAVQAAIDAGGRGPGGNGLGTTGAPAVIYFPDGIYVLGETINSYVDTRATWTSRVERLVSI